MKTNELETLKQWHDRRVASEMLDGEIDMLLALRSAIDLIERLPTSEDGVIRDGVVEKLISSNDLHAAVVSHLTAERDDLLYACTEFKSQLTILQPVIAARLKAGHGEKCPMGVPFAAFAVNSTCTCGHDALLAEYKKIWGEPNATITEKETQVFHAPRR